MRVCCISDLHEQWDKVAIPECDLLIVAGDWTYRGSREKVQGFLHWLDQLQDGGTVKHIVAVPGNHDYTLDAAHPKCDGELVGQVGAYNGHNFDIGTFPFLVEVGGLKVWACPYSSAFGEGWGFQLERGPAAKAHYAKIPASVDIVVTHGPALGCGDKVPRPYGGGFQRVGCKELYLALEEVRPLLHVFGHIHEGYGRYETGYATAVNASVCNRRYEPVNRPIVVDL